MSNPYKRQGLRRLARYYLPPRRAWGDYTPTEDTPLRRWVLWMIRVLEQARKEKEATDG